MAVVPGSPSSSPPAEQAPATLLLVEDDAALATVLASALEARGHRVHVEPTGRGALQAVSVHSPDVVILDLGLPDLDGLEVCRSLRRWFPYPIIVLSADADEGRKVAALDLGADDYVTKPFDLAELIARIRAILRRTAGHPADVLAVGTLALDAEGHQVTRAGRTVRVSATEFRLLRYLMENAGRVVSKAQILDRVWRDDFGGDASIVDTYISYLRRKVDTEEPKLIHTVHGVGYVLREPRR
jgi:two-component system OmpR family response regulator